MSGLVQCFGSPIKMPLLKDDRSPLLDDMKFVSEEGINLCKLHTNKHGRMESAKGSYAKEWVKWDKQLQDVYATESNSNKNWWVALKNVLSFKRYVRSGKSKTIHAFAIEEGIKVLKNNASNFQFGDVMKQKFGKILESTCQDKWIRNPLELQNMNTMETPRILYNGEAP